MREVSPESLDLCALIKPGDRIVWGQATGEPQTLCEALVRQRQDIGGVDVFLGACFSQTLQAEHADHIRMRGFGALGTASRLAKAGVLELVPCHVGQVARYIEEGYIGCDIAFVQVSPPGPDGRFSFGVIHDYIPAAVAAAHVVVAEVNDRVPWTYAARSLGKEDIDVAVRTSRPVLEASSAGIGGVEREIARHAGTYIVDGSVLQVGIGSIPDAILQSISDRRDLGLHSGMAGDALVDLVEAGAMTNGRKRIDCGVAIAGALIGSERLYRFAHLNRSLMMRDSSYTHNAVILEQLDNYVSINSATEIDLTGQVNAETAGRAYIGATGGQVDYVRAGHRSRGGHSIVACAATAQGGMTSRICAQIGGPVTTARSEVDVVVTEFGAAELRAQPLRERARRLIEIAHPKFREDLERAAYELLRRGY